jgi:transposase
MITLGAGTKVYVAVGPTDLRKAMDSLAKLVAGQLGKDPFSGHLFAFCNRRRTVVKILLWDRNGFWLLHKRLEKETFRWPRTGAEVRELTPRELGWLLDGLDPSRLRGHSELTYSTVF